MKHNSMKVWEVSESIWDAMDAAVDGAVIVTEKQDGWYMMATSAADLDSTIKAIMQALDDDGVKVFNNQMAAWLDDLNGEAADSFQWTESGVDDCLRGKWQKSWEIEYNDNDNWTIFLAVAK